MDGDSCDLDALYECEDVVNTELDDELLISLVKANPMLYDKSQKDFKNQALKKDTWTAISVGCGAPTGEAAEKRWLVLRNMLGKKMRELKEKGVSGSKGGKKITPWPLLGPMSFILPFIDNRRKRGSSLLASTSGRSSPATHSGRSTPASEVLSPRPSPPQSPSTFADVLPSAAWDSTASLILTPSSNEECNNESESVEDCSGESPRTSNLNKKRKIGNTVVPKPDQFSTRKNKKLDKIEALMQQSAASMKVIAEALAEPEKEDKQQSEKEHPYMTAVKKAFTAVQTMSWSVSRLSWM